MKNFILRYIAQNSTPVFTDVLKEEVRDTCNGTWFDILRALESMNKMGWIYKPSNSKNATLKLTTKGWGEFEKQMVGVELDILVENIEEPEEIEEINLTRLHIRYEGVIKRLSQWKVAELDGAEDNGMELVGNH